MHLPRFQAGRRQAKPLSARCTRGMHMPRYALPQPEALPLKARCTRKRLLRQLKLRCLGQIPPSNPYSHKMHIPQAPSASVPKIYPNSVLLEAAAAEDDPPTKGSFIRNSPLQPEKAPLPIVAAPFGTVISVIPIQPLKAPAPIDSIPSGRAIAERAAHPENASSPNSPKTGFRQLL